MALKNDFPAPTHKVFVLEKKMCHVKQAIIYFERP